MWFCTGWPSFVRIRSATVITSYRFSKMAAIPSQTYFRFRIWLRLTFLKIHSYLRTKCRLRYYYFRFLQANGRHTEILLWVSILTFSPPSACDTAWAHQILSKFDDADGVMTSYRFCKMAAIASQIYFRFLGFWFGHAWHLRRLKACGVPNFYQIFQATAEILLLVVHKDKRPPYWTSTFGFDFDLSTVVGV